MNGNAVPDPLDFSTTASVLDSVPFCVLIFEEGCIKWANKYFNRSFSSLTHSVIDLTAEQALDTPHAPLFENAEQLCLTDTNGQAKWLQRETMASEASGFEIHFLKDISRTIELEKEKDDLIANLQLMENQNLAEGILNKLSLMQALNVQVSRSRRYDNPLSLLRLTLEIPPSGSEQKNEIVLSLSQDLKDQLRWADQIGMLDDQTFIVILPETCHEDAKELAPKLASSRTALASISPGCTLKFSATEWQKGDDPEKLLKKLENDLELDTAALFS